MRYSLDTQLLLWVTIRPEKLSVEVAELIEDRANHLVFSAASIWEIAIKRGLGRADFDVDPQRLRRSLLDSEYEELPITCDHAVAVEGLPAIHKDPFDRLLVAQAVAEGMVLLTTDRRLAEYGGMVRLV